MKKFLMFVAVLLGGLTLVACNNDPKPDPTPNPTPDDEEKVDIALPEDFVNLVGDRKVYLTTIGQNADVDTVYNLILSIYGEGNQAEAEQKVTKNNLLTAAEVEDGALVIVVPGASSKGMGAAGTNQSKEEGRGIALTAKAASGKIDLVLVHTGGSQRRGGESDPLISSVGTEAKLILVVGNANSDGFFTTMGKNNEVPVFYYSTAFKLVPPFKQLFNK